MSTPILNPNSSSTTKTNDNSIPTSTLSQYQVELGKVLCKHDPTAIRMYDFINYVRVFRYNTHELRWENHSVIEGNLFLYKRKQLINNQMYQVFAFAIIQGDRDLIQPISLDMTEQADKQCIFYEVKKHDESLVFSLHFSSESECLRMHKFIQKLLQSMKEQQNHLTNPGELQQIPVKGQSIARNEDPSQLIINRPSSVVPQVGSSRQAAMHISGRQSTPLTNSNDPTSSLKRLLNIPNANISDNETNLPSSQNSINLLPPSAFAVFPSSAGADYSDNQFVAQTNPANVLNREHFRNVLLHLVKTNEQFVDIIHQACLNYSTQ
ncbi:unnamed protein product [Adineta ricciae]|uniref:mRNA-decapping enzyme C-terminal domain-containing protein n=1 Tax=Adineta ricciae TaxID=249248 RepID=A0A813WQC6_ADIRI|nr:unnamed protein product [Adineta ricciae]